jgi:hypothetical protein
MEKNPKAEAEPSSELIVELVEHPVLLRRNTRIKMLALTFRKSFSDTRPARYRW